MINDQLIREFSRYIFVGGSAFAVDFALLFLFKNYVFANFGESGVYLAACIGFAGGLIYNYILSLLFVFESAKTKNSGKSVGGFITFTLIGVVGLLLTEFGMYIGTHEFAANYLIVKLFVAMIVFAWNFGIKKLLIFQ